MVVKISREPGKSNGGTPILSLFLYIYDPTTCLCQQHYDRVLGASAAKCVVGVHLLRLYGKW